MAIPFALPDDVRHAIGEMIERRRSVGVVSTGHVIRELKRSLPVSDHDPRELANVIAREAVRMGMHVHFEPSTLPWPSETWPERGRATKSKHCY